MRIAVVSDIHANLTALDAVIADLQVTGPDLVVCGGDLMSGGPRPADVIDRVRGMNWPAVYGNTDEMLWMPQRVSETLRAAGLRRMMEIVLTHTIPATLAAIGPERLAWLRALPRQWSGSDLSVVHATPDDAWATVTPKASDDEMERVYGPLGTTRVVYGHIHQPYIRRVEGLTVANSGAVSLSFDGDPRASYALVDDERIEIRRVAYDVEEEARLLLRTDDPFAVTTIETLRTGRYVPIADGDATAS